MWSWCFVLWPCLDRSPAVAVSLYRLTFRLIEHQNIKLDPYVTLVRHLNIPLVQATLDSEDRIPSLTNYNANWIFYFARQQRGVVPIMSYIWLIDVPCRDSCDIFWHALDATLAPFNLMLGVWGYLSSQHYLCVGELWGIWEFSYEILFSLSLTYFLEVSRLPMYMLSIKIIQ